MDDVVLDSDPAHLPPEAEEWLVQLLSGLDITAEAPEPPYETPVDPHLYDDGVTAWTLRLRWTQVGPVAADSEAALRRAFPVIRDHFTDSGWTPPNRLAVLGPDGSELLRFAPGDEAAAEAGNA